MSIPAFDPPGHGTLAGIRVIDLSRLVAGNVLTGLMADFGAEVIKVEPPEGDTLRQWQVKGVATAWKVYARNKQSIAIDFRSAGARGVLLDLAASAQVFVESFRPGTLEAMGLAPQTLLERNPKLVIVRISGWGQDGPYRQRPGFGTLIEGLSGFASMNGFADREPVLPPFYLADSVAGLHGVASVMFALREVEVNGGAGQVIDLALLDPLFAVLGPQAANYKLTGTPKPRTGSRSTNAAPRNAYRTQDDRWVCLSASTQQMAERLLRSIGRGDLIADARFKTNTARVKHAATLDAIIGAFIATRTQAENVEFFEAAAVTIGPILDISGIVSDPHVVARGLIRDYPDDEMGTMPMQSIVPRLSKTPGRVQRAAPRVGVDSAAVMHSIGRTDADIANLVATGLLKVEQAK